MKFIKCLNNTQNKIQDRMVKMNEINPFYILLKYKSHILLYVYGVYDITHTMSVRETL